MKTNERKINRRNHTVLRLLVLLFSFDFIIVGDYFVCTMQLFVTSVITDFCVSIKYSYLNGDSGFAFLYTLNLITRLCNEADIGLYQFQWSYTNASTLKSKQYEMKMKINGKRKKKT